MKKNILFGSALAALMLTAACSTEELGSGSKTPYTGAKFVVAATSADATYLLSMSSVTEGEASIKQSGTEVDNATSWVFWGNKYAYRLVYNQGNAGVTTSYTLDQYGEIQERNIRHEIQSRFTTYGTYGDHIITAASGATDQKDASGNAQYGITFTKIDVQKQTLTTQTVGTENLLGTGEYCTVSGIVESAGKIYTAVCPEGVSVYGVQNNGNLLSDDAKALVNTEGGISGTVTPNSVWVAIYSGSDFSSPKIIRDNRISYATSRYRSQYYSTIDADAEGNIYVFSPSHATSMTGIQKTTLPSGVVRIKAGAEAFDPDYYVNLEEESVAGRAMYKVWHIRGDYFLMQMYAEKGDDKSYKVNTNRLAIFKAGDKKFTWITGLPEASVISSLSKNAYSDGVKAYIALTTTTGAQPTVYAIDPATATASSGVQITAAQGITAIGKLSNE